MATEVARLRAVLDADTRGFDSGMSSAERRMKGSSHNIRRGALLIGSAVAGIGIASAIGAKKAIDAASDLNESVNAVNVVFGKASDKVQAFSEVAATEAGLSMRALNELVTPVGANLRNVGFSADEAAEASINLAKRASDMASVFNVDVGEAMTAIQAALRGEADPIERFGVGLNEAAIEAYGLKKGLIDAGEEMTNQQKVQARLGLLFEQTNRIQGDFQNTSDGLANSQRILKAEFENVTAEVGTALLPVATKLMGLLADLVPIVRDLAGQFIDFLKPAFEAVGDAFTGRGQEISDILWKIRQFLWRHVIPVIEDLRDLAVRTFRAMAKVIQDNREPLERIAARIGKLVDIIWTVLKPILDVVFTKILPTALGLAIKWIDKVTQAVELQIDIYGKLWDWIKKVFNWVNDHIVPLVLKPFIRVKNTIEDIVDVAKKAFDAIKAGIDKVKGPLGEVAGFFGKILGFLGGIKEKAGGVFGGLIPDGIIGVGMGAAAGGVSAGGLVPQIMDDLALGQAMGLSLTSGLRPGAITSTGNPSLHGVGRAIDMAGTPAEMRRYFLAEVARGAFTGLAEIIHSPYWWHPGSGITRIPASAGTVLRDHYNHVHVGTYDRGGFLRPGWNLAYNGLGRPEPVGGGVTVNVQGSVIAERDLHSLVRRMEDDHRRRGGL